MIHGIQICTIILIILITGVQVFTLDTEDSDLDLTGVGDIRITRIPVHIMDTAILTTGVITRAIIRDTTLTIMTEDIIMDTGHHLNRIQCILPAMPEAQPENRVLLFMIQI